MARPIQPVALAEKFALIPDAWHPRIVGEGEFLIVSRGVEHLPGAVDDEAWVLPLESKTTLNTGNTRSELTRDHLEWL